MAETIKNRRIYWVDSLRGVAALLVAIIHVWLHLKHLYPSQFVGIGYKIAGGLISDYVDLGKIGVIIFFIISGYVVPFSLIGKDLKNFSISRFFRLYPAYWFSILLFIIIIGFPPLKQLLLNITMFQKFFGVPDLIGVYWTLQIEIIFYIICATLFYTNHLQNTDTINKLYLLFLFLSLVLAIFRFTLDIKLPVALPLALSAMFLGMKFRYKELNGKKIDTGIIKSILLFSILLFPISLFAYNKDFGFGEKWYRYFISYNIAFCLFILFSQKAIYNKWFGIMGNISYSVYLIHPILGLELADIIVEKWPALNNTISFSIIFFVLTILGSLFSFYVIEKRFQNLGKFYTRSKTSKIINNTVL
jgi:peptidoglycan/LPS O-acetylase OafA/YrhL